MAVVAFPLFILPMQTHAQTHKEQEANKGDKPSLATAPVPAQQNDAPALQPKHQEHVDADVRVVSTPAKDGYDKAAVWVNVGLGIIGVCGIIVAVVTLRKVERQTAATEKAANASLINIQAFVNSERPWIQVAYEIERGYGIAIKAINKGRTPAAIISHSIGFKTIEMLGDLPKTPEYGKTETFSEPKIVLPDESFTLHSFLTKREFGIPVRSEQHSQFIEFAIEPHVFGSVSYRDVLSPVDSSARYETSWCYYMMPWGKESREEIMLFDGRAEGYTRHT